MNRLLYLFLLNLALLPADAQVVKVSPQQTDSLLRASPGVQVLDVRTPGEFAGGHLKNARNLNIRDSVFTTRLTELDRSKPVLVYCLAGSRSAKAAGLLADAGFKTVYDMQGGFAKWSASGKPIEGAPPAPRGTVSMDDFKKLTASSKPVLVDFYAKWCGPCQQMLPMIDRLKTELANQVTILTLDYDQNRSLALQLGVDEIPTFLLYKSGKLHWRGLGMIEEKMFREKIQASQ